MPTDSDELKILEAKIAAKRRQLMALYEARGCTDDEVLATGIELDELLNKQHRLNFSGVSR